MEGLESPEIDSHLYSTLHFHKDTKANHWGKDFQQRKLNN